MNLIKNSFLAILSALKDDVLRNLQINVFFSHEYFNVMSPRMSEQTSVTMSPTTNGVAQSHFGTRNPKVSIMILPCGACRKSPGRAILVPTNCHVNHSLLRVRVMEKSDSWKRNISIVLSASLFLSPAIWFSNYKSLRVFIPITWWSNKDSTKFLHYDAS